MALLAFVVFQKLIYAEFWIKMRAMNWNSFRAGFFICLLLLCTILAGCKAQEKWHTVTFLFFDTVCEVKVFSAQGVFRSAQEKIQRLFSEISENFSPDSKNYSSPMAVNLFRRALEIHRASDGFFDVTIAPLTKIWGFRDGSNRIPTPSAIQDALSKVGMLRIRKEGEALILPKGMELDWGGIAKGYGIDLASRALIEMGIESGFLNAGGDLFCWGKNPEKVPWKIGIKHPREDGVLGVLHITELGAATAGDYQRFFVKDGIRYHHIFDPKTGFPVKGKQSVTVIGPETLICDALSTALFVSGQPESIINNFPKYGAILVDKNGHLQFLGHAYSFLPSQ